MVLQTQFREKEIPEKRWTKITSYTIPIYEFYRIICFRYQFRYEVKFKKRLFAFPLIFSLELIKNLAYAMKHQVEICLGSRLPCSNNITSQLKTSSFEGNTFSSCILDTELNKLQC